MQQIELLAEQCNEALGVEGKVYVGRHHEELVRIPTGLLAFDAISGGGLVRKHYHELYGEESAGKTTVALMICAAVQRAGGVAAWVVGEEFDDDWAEKQGVDVDHMVKIEALTGDLMLETAATYLASGLIDVMVVDSIQAIGTKRENEAGVDQEAYAGGGAPQMWARFYRRSRSLFNAGQAQTAIIGISQVRDKIGGFAPGGMKPEPTPTQIRVIKHWKSISILCKKGEPRFLDPKSEKRKIVAREFHLRCVKNKTAAPEGVGSFWYNFRGDHFGIDKADEVLRLARVYDLIEQKGRILEGYGIRVMGSKDDPASEQFKMKLRKNPVILRELQTDILSAIQG